MYFAETFYWNFFLFPLCFWCIFWNVVELLSALGEIPALIELIKAMHDRRGKEYFKACFYFALIFFMSLLQNVVYCFKKFIIYYFSEVFFD
jgi:hypothetical protein